MYINFYIMTIWTVDIDQEEGIVYPRGRAGMAPCRFSEKNIFFLYIGTSPPCSSSSDFMDSVANGGISDRAKESDICYNRNIQVLQSMCMSSESEEI